MPYLGNDVGVLEGAGDRLEDAIGRISELTGNYFAAK